MNFQNGKCRRFGKFKSLFYVCTGWSISILYTLTGWYDKNNACSKKIMVDLCSIYPDISFDNKKSEKITDISFHNRNNRIIINYKNKL